MDRDLGFREKSNGDDISSSDRECSLHTGRSIMMRGNAAEGASDEAAYVLAGTVLVEPELRSQTKWSWGNTPLVLQ
jgi:hypothetical protein